MGLYRQSHSAVKYFYENIESKVAGHLTRIGIQERREGCIFSFYFRQTFIWHSLCPVQGLDFRCYPLFRIIAVNWIIPQKIIKEFSAFINPEHAIALEKHRTAKILLSH